MNINDVKQFLELFKTCVISTVSQGGQPEAATVGFSVDDDFKIMIATNEKTRKAANLAVNNRVAFVVGFDGPRTLQIEGMAVRVNLKEAKDRIDLHFKKVPGAQKFAGELGQNYYLITPNWLRFTDYTNENPIFETRSFV